jgi:hypothetical protein
MMLQVDHLMWGAPDLALGIAEAQRILGVEAAVGGSHPGLGTRNALLALGDTVYLEIIAPDPDQDLRGTLGERLRTLDECALVTWAVRCDDLAELATRAAAQNMKVRGPTRTQRRTPSGDLLEWELLFLPAREGPQEGARREGGHEFPSLVPFFIDWLDSPHPATRSPRGGEFVELVLHSPRHAELGALLDGLGVAVTVEHAAEEGLEARIRVGDEVISLRSSPQTRGLSF